MEARWEMFTLERKFKSIKNLKPLLIVNSQSFYSQREPQLEIFSSVDLCLIAPVCQTNCFWAAELNALEEHEVTTTECQLSHLRLINNHYWLVSAVLLGIKVMFCWVLYDFIFLRETGFPIATGWPGNHYVAKDDLGTSHPPAFWLLWLQVYTTVHIRQSTEPLDALNYFR